MARKEASCFEGQCAVQKHIKCDNIGTLKRKGKVGKCFPKLCNSDRKKGQYGDLVCMDLAMEL